MNFAAAGRMSGRFAFVRHALTTRELDQISSEDVSAGANSIYSFAMSSPNPAAILAFYAEAGVDIALEETPQNWFAGEESVNGHSGARRSGEPGIQRPPTAMMDSGLVPSKSALADLDNRSPIPGKPGIGGATRNDDRSQTPSVLFTPSPAPAPPDEAALEARELAAKAESLEELRELLVRFEGCALKKTAKNLVFADGNPEAKVMFVGEAPGADEDREGLPFVGRSGKLLDLMIAAIGLDRSSAYIANIVPWRPPGNRTPTPQETSICLPFIKRQIELANPDILICLGKPSMQTLLGVNEGIRAARGRWREYDTGTRTIRAMATFHPAYLLRSPNERSSRGGTCWR
jgi:DNA polymerase